MIDGALAGGFAFEQSRFGDKTRELYLLCDFALFRERRLSKLIAMLATSRDVIDPINKRLLVRIERIAGDVLVLERLPSMAKPSSYASS